MITVVATFVPAAEDDEEVLEVEAEADDEVDEEVEVEVDEPEVKVEADVSMHRKSAAKKKKRDARGHRDARESANKEASDVKMTWVSCDACHKWRRMPVSDAALLSTDYWACSMMGTLFRRMNCNTPQENPDEDDEEDERRTKRRTRELPEGVAKLWVQCEDCTKWRSLPVGTTVGEGQHWVCAMNPRSSHSRCEVAEEKLDDDEAEAEDAAVADAEAAADEALAAVEAAQKAVLSVRMELEQAQQELRRAKEASTAAAEAVRGGEATLEKAEADAEVEAAAVAEEELAAAAAVAAAIEAAKAEAAAAAAAWIRARDQRAALAAAKAAAATSEEHPGHEGKEAAAKSEEHPGHEGKEAAAKSEEHPGHEGKEAAAKSEEHPGPEAKEAAAKSEEHPGPEAKEAAAKSEEHPSPEAKEAAAKSEEHPGHEGKEAAAKSEEHPGPEGKEAAQGSSTAAVMLDRAEPSAADGAQHGEIDGTNDVMTRAKAMGEAKAMELLERAEAAKRGGNCSLVVHEWSIAYVLRPPGSCSRGDIYMVDPIDGEVIRSMVGLKRKLGLAPLAPSREGRSSMPLAAFLPQAAAAAPSVPGTRRQKALARPKAEAAREARRQLARLEAEDERAKHTEAAVALHVEHLATREIAAVTAADEAVAALRECERQVATAYQAARAAEQARRASRMHVCFAVGCRERFADAAALRLHEARAHRRKTSIQLRSS